MGIGGLNERSRIGGKGMTSKLDRIQENANKYIVKNCPAIYEFFNYYCKKDGEGLCQDCTDCVIKQVIEKCKDSKLSYSNLEILRTACETSETYGKAVMAEQILQLFDIEEITE